MSRDKNDNSSKQTTTFKALYKKYYSEDPQPFRDFREPEVRIACILTMLFIVLIWVYGETNSVIEITESVKVIVLGIAFSMIGLLGFVVTGLSILLGTTSKSFYIILTKNNLEKEFQKILFSFYYLGYMLGIVIVLSIINYFLIALELPFVFWLFIVIAIIYFYLVIFVIFYAINLLGVCFVFFMSKLNIEVSKEYEIEKEREIEMAFLKLKTEALSEIVFNEGNSETFFIEIKRQLDVIPYEYRDELRQKVIDFYELDKK